MGEELEKETKTCRKCGYEWTGNPYASEVCPYCKRELKRAQTSKETRTKRDWRDLKTGQRPGYQRSLEDFQ